MRGLGATYRVAAIPSAEVPTAVAYQPAATQQALAYQPAAVPYPTDTVEILSPTPVLYKAAAPGGTGSQAYQQLSPEVTQALFPASTDTAQSLPQYGAPAPAATPADTIVSAYAPYEGGGDTSTSPGPSPNDSGTSSQLVDTTDQGYTQDDLVDETEAGGPQPAGEDKGSSTLLWLGLLALALGGAYLYDRSQKKKGTRRRNRRRRNQPKARRSR